MKRQTELATRQSTQVEPRRPDMMSLLRLAISKESAIDVIERLAAMQRESRDYDARVAFDQAMHRVQEKIKRIGKDAKGDGKKWATLEKVDRSIKPLYAAEGFSISFDTGDYADPNFVLLYAYVSHTQGHTRRYQLLMPADGKGAKGGDVQTRTHATGSAATYGRRYLLGMIWNLSFGDTDDDGNAASLPASDKKELEAMVKNAKTLEELTPAYTTALKAATNSKDVTLVGLLGMAAADRKKELLAAKEAENA